MKNKEVDRLLHDGTVTRPEPELMDDEFEKYSDWWDAWVEWNRGASIARASLKEDLFDQDLDATEPIEKLLGRIDRALNDMLARGDVNWHSRSRLRAARSASKAIRYRLFGIDEPTVEVEE